MLPLVEELPPMIDAVTAFEKLRQQPGVCFFDSALPHAELGRYSFVSADPVGGLKTYAVNGDCPDPLARLADVAAGLRGETVAGLPPFQGGVVALLSYDLSRSLERLPVPQCDEFAIPALTFGVYNVMLAFDHQAGRGWVISHGDPRTEGAVRRRDAERRLLKFRDWLAGTPRGSGIVFGQDVTTRPRLLAENDSRPLTGRAELRSNFSREKYLAAARRAVEYIHAGDVFQVNLAQRLLHPATCDSAELYLRLRERNPATFAAYFDLGNFQIISASPERLVSVQEGRVEARPIKGTRQRSRRPEADLFAGDDLQQSEKDRAENVMIVDLLRNDLSRVCTPESVRVTQLCGLETYQFVQHLVSVIEGRLAANVSPVDVLRAVFPGGSITGAPKVRAMEIIAELEPSARGAYCGSLGYIGFDGAMDFNILIRTITAGRGWWQLPVGGGIVAQSEPEREYDETWHKATGMLRALEL